MHNLELPLSAGRPQLSPYEEVATYLRRLCRHNYIYAHIEPTNACNTLCSVCPRDAMTRKVGLMAWPIFQAVSERILPTALPMIAFVGYGEPTLHTRLPAMIAHVRDARPDIIIKLTTNASLLAGNRLDRLYEAGLDLLEISGMGSSPEAYTQAMRLSFEDLSTLLARLNRENRNYTVASFPMAGETIEEVKSFWTSAGARSVEVKGLHRRGGHLKRDSIRERDQHGGYRSRGEAGQDGTAVDACHKLYLFLHIDSSGTIIPCVQDINSRHALGNAVAARDMDHIVAATRAHRPTFDICKGCELRRQDLFDYYTRFFATRFAARLPALIARLSRLENGDVAAGRD